MRFGEDFGCGKIVVENPNDQSEDPSPRPSPHRMGREFAEDLRALHP